MSLRFAAASDCRAMLDIYAQYIDTNITFETALPSEEDFSGRIENISREYPWLVWEECGKILGYAYAHRLHERAAYQWDAELSVYLDKSCVSRGMGKRLYLALFDILRMQGIHTVYGIVTSPNEKSERLHHSLGFRLIGVHRNTGYKNGRWIDVSWFERAIAAYDAAPRPFIPIDGVAQDKLALIVEKYS